MPASTSKNVKDPYFSGLQNIIDQHKLLSELALRHGEDSTRSEAHAIASKTLLRVLPKKRNANGPSIFLTEIERNCMDCACIFVKAMMDWKFMYKDFYDALCAYPIFPLEFIFRLHLLGVMTLDTYLTIIQTQPEVISIFCESVVSLFSQHDPNIEFERLMMSGVSAYVVNNAFESELEESSDLQCPRISKICKLIVDHTITQLVESRRRHLKPTNVSSLILFWGNSSMEYLALQEFCIYALEMMITWKPYIEVTQAILLQPNWTHKNTENEFLALTRKVLITVGSGHISSTILDILASNRQNWEILLTVVSVYITCCQDASTFILGWVEVFLKKAFEKSEKLLLYHGFLFARHVTLLEHSSCSLTYFNWFQKTFGDSTSLYIKDAKSFELLMEFLTEIVPFEKEYLKIHIEKPPHIPKDCRIIYLDYVALVKTRLSELEPQQSPDVVLNKMFAAFEMTGKIPAALLELSILQKHRYLNYFIPKLLTPRVLPQVPDTKMKFLQALKTCGKVPKEMFEKYETECRQLTENLSDVQPMDIEISENNEQIFNWSMEFMFQVQNGAKDANSLKQCLHEFRQKLHSNLEPFKASDCITPFVLLNAKIDAVLKTMMQEIIDSYCTFETEVFNRSWQNSVSWNLEVDLQCYPMLHNALYQALWKSIKCQAVMTFVSSSLLLRISMLHSKYPLVKECSNSNSIQFCEFIFKELPLTTSEEIDYFCRFSCQYLNSACSQCPVVCNIGSISALPLFIPVNLIKKFRFAAVRSMPELRLQVGMFGRNGDHLNAVDTVYISRNIHHLFTITDLSFSEWLTYESNLWPEKDNLDIEERCKYSLWCIQHLCYFKLETFDHFLNAKIKYSCQTIFHLLLLRYDQCRSFSSMLLLLKDLLKHSVESKDETSLSIKPWLYEELSAAIDKRKNSKCPDLYLNILMKRFFRLITELPEFLLFQNFSVKVTYANGLKGLSNLLNEWIRLHNGKNVFLPHAFISHIIKGLSSLLIHSKHHEEFQKNDAAVKSFLSSTPLFVLSLIEHWSTVKASVPSILSNRQSQFYLLLSEIDAFTVWAKCLQSAKRNPYVNIKELDDWMMGYILIKEKVDYDAILPHISSGRVSFKALGFAVHFHVILNIALDISKAIISSNVLAIVKPLTQLMKVEFLDPLHYHESSLKELFSASVWYHFPAGCVRLLFQVFDKEEIQKSDKLIIGNWLSLILSSIAECNHRYIDRNFINQFHHYLNEDSTISKEQYGILNLNFLQEATQEAKNILELAPPDCVALIPQGIVDACDEYLRCFVKKKES